MNVTFAKGGASKSGGGIVSAVVDAVTGAAGSGGCGSGTHNGKRGFTVGNKCGGKRDANSPTSKASGAHRSARKSVSSHVKAGTLASKAGRESVRTAAKAHRELQAARVAQKSAKSAAGKSSRAVASGRASALPAPGAKPPATPTTAPKPTVADRVKASAKEASDTKAARATQHLKDLHEGAKAGSLKPTDIHKHADRIARGATKDELFAAAKAAGIEHKATTKKALVEHIKEHAHSASKPKAEMSSKDFAAKVVQGAHASPTGGFGGEKTFISHAKAHLDRTEPAIRAMSDADFKAKLLQANREGHLELGRGDLTPSMNQADVKASSTPHMGVEYHFIRHPSKSAAVPQPKATPKAGPAKPAAAGKPTADQGLAHLRHLQHNSRSIAPADLDAEVSKLRHLPQKDFDRAIGDFVGSGAKGGKQQKIEAARKKIHEYSYMAARTDKIAGTAATKGDAGKGPLSHLPAVADRAKAAPKPAAPARTVKATPPPELGPSSRSALEGLRSVQARAHTLAPSEIDAHVSSISKLGSGDLDAVAHHYLGSKVGGTKADKLREISRKIHGYRQAVDRVKGIEEYK